MTTNNPPIAAWAPSTALAKLASRHNNAPCVLTDGPAEFNDVALVRLSDYEALERAAKAEADAAQLAEALELALEYWRDRQQRYKNRRPKWVVAAESALAAHRKGGEA